MRLLTILLILCSFMAQSQNLPRWMTPEEKLQMPAYLASFDQLQKTASTPVNPRNMAEWEEVDYLVITWTSFRSILAEIVRHGKEEATVIIVCSDSNSVKSYLQNRSVTLDNIMYLEEGYNSIWIRDYFGNTAYKNGYDSLVMVDWVYNRPRPLDDKVVHKVANLLNIPIYETATQPDRLIHTGGNYMSDGMGTGFSSELVLDENSNKTATEVDQLMEDYLGINPYVKMKVLPYDDIHHIDMHMKLMNENTLLIGEYPTGKSDGPQIEANIDYVLNNYTTPSGAPYNIERIVMPEPPSGIWPNQGGNYYTYANMLFVNKTILVPIYNLDEDEEALEKIREVMPGFKVVGINCSSIIPSGGAIHCITHTIGVNHPLIINHEPLADQEADGNDYQIMALASHISGVNSVDLYWTTDTTQAYNSISMTPTSNPLDEWYATIPNQPAGSTVYYYFDAAASSGKTLTRPLTAPQGYFSFDVIPAVGLKEISKNDVRVYPNPASAITGVEFPAFKNESISISIFDITGKIILQEQLIGNPNGEGKMKWFFDASLLESGFYTILFEKQNSKLSKKLIIK